MWEGIEKKVGMVNYNTTSLYDALWECKSLSLEFTLGGFN